MDSRKENLNAFGRFNPNNRAAEMVMPLRLSPGKIANPCATPIKSATL
jgi:hypothetical protein